MNRIPMNRQEALFPLSERKCGFTSFHLLHLPFHVRVRKRRDLHRAEIKDVYKKSLRVQFQIASLS